MKTVWIIIFCNVQDHSLSCRSPFNVLGVGSLLQGIKSSGRSTSRNMAVETKHMYFVIEL